MRRFLFLVLFVFGLLIARSQSIEYEWTKVFDSEIGIVSSTVDEEKNLILVGNFGDTVDFDPGTGVINEVANGIRDIFILKLDSNGVFKWVETFGDAHYNSATDVLINRDGDILISGYFNVSLTIDTGNGTISLFSNNSSKDIYIMKLSDTGGFKWIKSIGGNETEGINSIEEDMDGYIYATGDFRGQVDFDSGLDTFNVTSSISGGDLYVLKLDPNGDFQWVQTIGDDANGAFANGNSICVDSFGYVYVTGIFSDTIDFNPDVGHFFLNSYSYFYPDFFILKLDSAGSFVWAMDSKDSLNLNTFAEGNSIHIDPFGDVIVSGTFNGLREVGYGNTQTSITSNGLDDVFILKLDPNGDLIWVRTFGSSGEETAIAGIDKYGNVYVSGVFNDTVDFNSGDNVYNLVPSYNEDIYLLKLNPFGNFLWVKNLEGISTPEYTSFLDVDLFGNIYMIGGFSGTLDFNPTNGIRNITSNSLNGFINKLSQCTPSIEYVSIQACDYYLSPRFDPFNPSGGGAYNQSTDTISFTLQASNGCDSIVYVDLTINNSSPAPTNRDTILICDSTYVWPVDGNTYDFVSGNNYGILSTHDLSHTYTNAGGCDSIVEAFLVMLNGWVVGIATTSTGEPILNSKVSLIEFDPMDSTLTQIDTAYTDSSLLFIDSLGIFFFTFVEESPNIFMKVIPDSVLYPGELPTYYNGSVLWQGASPAFCESSFSTIAGVNPGGDGFIGGFINQGAGKSGNAAGGVTVILVNSDGEVVAMTTTDENGYFSFDDIPEDDTYSIWVDQPFLHNSLAPEIELTNSEPEKDSLQFLLHPTYLELLGDEEEDSVDVGIAEYEQFDFKVYPNPTNSSFNIDLSGMQQNNGQLYKVEIYDVVGQLIYSKEAEQEILNVSTDQWSSGLYNIRLINKSGNAFGYKKLVVTGY
ncbi:MAG: T9SS type A sorting domain-containing protein [Chitinophagales bacterium]